MAVTVVEFGRLGRCYDTPRQTFGDMLGTRVVYNFKEFFGDSPKDFGEFMIEICAISKEKSSSRLKF